MSDLGELYAALSKAQGQMAAAKKGNVNPHFKSSYADLASVWEACRAPLAENDLCVLQIPEQEDGAVVVVTTLGHSSGQSVSSRVRIPVDRPTAHGYGSALTYARRYGLSSLVGIAQDDDDANGAAPQRGGYQGRRQQDQRRGPPPVDQALIEEIQAKASFLDDEDQQGALAYLSKNHTSTPKLKALLEKIEAKLSGVLDTCKHESVSPHPQGGLVCNDCGTSLDEETPPPEDNNEGDETCADEGREKKGAEPMPKPQQGGKPRSASENPAGPSGEPEGEAEGTVEESAATVDANDPEGRAPTTREGAVPGDLIVCEHCSTMRRREIRHNPPACVSVPPKKRKRKSIGSPKK